MKIVSVYGTKKSGKTTVVTSLIRALTRRGHRVASLKYMERADRIDITSTETDIHRRAGAALVITSARRETAILRAAERRESLSQQLDHVGEEFDYLICEGQPDPSVHRIATAKHEEELERVISDQTVAISGIVATKLKDHRLPFFDVTRDLEPLVAFLEGL